MNVYETLLVDTILLFHVYVCIYVFSIFPEDINVTLACVLSTCWRAMAKTLVREMYSLKQSLVLLHRLQGKHTCCTFEPFLMM